MGQIASNPPTIKFSRTGTAILTAGFIVGIAITLGLANTGSISFVIALPVAILMVGAICVFFANPVLNLMAAILGFVLMASNETGFQAIEIAYAAYLLVLLMTWLLRHAFFDPEKILTEKADWALAIFLGLLPVTLILTGVFQGEFRIAASELLSLSMLLIYFPVKHTVAYHKLGPKIILVTMIVMCSTVALSNTFNYASDLSNAISLSHIAGSRVVVNDGLLMIGALMSLILLVYARGPTSVLLSISALALTFAGLIMTQSRGSWLAFLLGTLSLILLVRTPARIKLLTIGGSITLVILGVGYALIGPFLNVVLEGIIERFGSITMAFSQDLSLVNRFRETSAVFEKIIVNPLIGYGPGVSYLFYDIVHQVTHTDSFVHNGYVGLWYKYGLWGLGLVLYFWYSSIKSGLYAFRSDVSDRWARLAGLAGAVPLVALTVSTLTQNPFFLKNYLFVIALAAGLATGAGQRISQKLNTSTPPITNHG